MKTLWKLALFGLVPCSSGYALSGLPSVKVVVSSDGGTLVRIVPRPPGEGSARAVVLKFDPGAGEYRRAVEFPLRNEVAPIDALVTSDCRYIVTFDDWGGMGETDNAVVVYRGTGELIKTWRLADIFSEQERANFKWNTASGITWRGAVDTFEMPKENVYWARIRLVGWAVGANNAGRELILDLSDCHFRRQ